MKITRTVNGTEIMFELTKNELSEAYNEYQNILDMDVVKQNITERLGYRGLKEKRKIQLQAILNSEKALSEIAREYRFAIDNCGCDGTLSLVDALVNYIDKTWEDKEDDD